MPTRKQLLIAAAIVFLINTSLPGLIVGDIAIAEIQFGILVPWLGMDVRYGQPIHEGSFYRAGNMEKIEGIHVYWPQLLLSISLSIILGAISIGVGKGVARSAKWLFRKSTESSSGNNV